MSVSTIRIDNTEEDEDVEPEYEHEEDIAWLTVEDEDIPDTVTETLPTFPSEGLYFATAHDQ
eukprot:5904265-Prorocentrum_lima.AAC.1